MKKLISLFVALVFVVMAVPYGAVSAFAAELNPCTISVESQSGLVGSTVEVHVKIKNNPGILAASLTVTFDRGLTLTGISNGEAFSPLTMTKPGKLETPCRFVWDSMEISPDDITDGDVLVLTFEIAPDAEAGTDLAVNISTKAGDIIDADLNPVEVKMVSGVVSVVDYTPGDVNNDGVVAPLDIVLLRRFLASGYDVTIVEPAADVNGDGNINVADIVLIRRYLAGGYGVELPPSGNKVCNHTLEKTDAVLPKCTENGNIEYWQCTKCKKYYLAADASNEITADEVLVGATGHTVVIDPAVQPTYDASGLTEGSHCSVCKEVIVAQTVIPPLVKNEYSITYHIANNDTYLAGINTDNPNPATYISEKGLVLEDLFVDGYIFEGWYDGAGSNGSLVKEIPVGAKGNKTFYAKWTKTEYKVMFESDLIPVANVTYTVDQGVVLPSPKLDGYIFAGWSDYDGEILKKVPVGTVGNKTYSANWISERNQAWAKKDIGEPIVYEDGNYILMIYEIGEIRNVPLYVIHDFGKINSDGVEKTATKTYSVTMSEEQMEKYTETVSKATTESFGWTLSSDWSEGLTVNENWAKENGMTVEEAESVCTNESNNWYVSSGSSGTDTTVEINTTDDYNLTTTTKNDKNYGSNAVEKRQDFSAGLGYDGKYNIGLGAKIEGVGIEGGGEAGIGLDLKYENGRTTNVTNGSEHQEGSEGQTGTVTQTGTNTTKSSSWNSESGYGGSSSLTVDTTISNAVSEKISNEYGYGKEYISSENQSETQGLVSNDEKSNEWSSSVTHSLIKSKEVTETYTTSNTKSGYHRWVMAGTAHVFAVVGYDITTDSYFVTNHTVMDDEMHQFEDYSYEYASYDDNQNGVIDFEIPDDISKYVYERVGASQGLEVSKDGIVTAYNGTDEFVLIPEYMTVENLNGKNSIVKVVGISANAFRGNTKIKAVEMSDYVTEIPENAFRGCTSLLSFEGEGITTIGANAFAGCSSLKACSIGESITSLGVGAFEGMEYFSVVAFNDSVVKAAVESGAKHITVSVGENCNTLGDTTLVIPSSTESFTFDGNGKTFNNLCIDSEAAKTNIYDATFNSTGKTPLKLSSADIALQEINVSAKGIGLVLSNPTTKLALFGESFITSENGKAIFCKNVSISKIKDGYYTHITANDNVFACGTVTDNGYLTGNVITIDTDTFENYAKGVVAVVFDANGGEVPETARTGFYGSPVGSLPTPTRDHYTFEGWFTASDGGNRITKDTILTQTEGVTFYAHWKLNQIYVYFDANGGEVSEFEIMYDYGTPIGYLPIPTKDYYTFTGWRDTFTGEMVTVNTVLTDERGTIFVAQWEQNKLSDWVLSTNAPSDALIEDEKWTYDKTTNITSSESYVEGYTLYDTTTEWSEYGPWSAWWDEYIAPSDSVKVETATGYTYYYFKCPDCGAHMHGYPTCYTWAGGCGKSNIHKNGGDYVWYYSTTSYNNAGLKEFHGTGKYYAIIDGQRMFRHEDGATTVYRSATRSLIYTYYHTKTESFTSNIAILPSDTISNVKKWVKYRAK